MPIRIYALAKDLKFDSKELVDLCTKAGITGKGSALASLEDDEVVKLKAFLEGGAAKRAAPAPHPIVDTKAVLSSPVSGVATLPPPPPPPTRTPPRAKPAPAAPPIAAPEPMPVAPPPARAAEPAPPAIVAKAPKAEPEVVEEAPAETTVELPAPVQALGKTLHKAAASTAPSPLGPQRRDSLLPSRSSGIKVIDTKTKRGAVDPNKGKEGDGGSKPPERRGAVMRFAEMPNVKQPTPSVRSNEPAPQKPVLRLPTDAIAGARKSGGAAPLQALTKKMEADRNKSKLTGDKKGPGKGAPLSPADLLSGKPVRGGKKSRPGAPGEEPGLADMASIRTDRQKARKTTAKPRGFGVDDETGRPRRRRTQVRLKHSASTAAPRKEKVGLELPCTVRSFSEAAGVSAKQVMQVLMGMNMMISINSPIPDEYVEMIAGELGVELEFKQPESLEEEALKGFEAEEEGSAELQPRPPIVTVLGHVDHGKTSLLDRIIGTNVVAGEAGGITQHIRAYLIETKDGRHVSFVDTPGHEAFTEMRARGANVTDIAVLVVAADDGVMPQTEEAISHAKAAEVPIVVAMNKIDLPGADEQKVLQQLATAGLLPSEWGGDVEVIRTSAVTGQGIDTLLETLLVTAELHEYKANPDRAASGMCLEAEQEAGRGVIAKLMVQNGTLKEGDIVVCGAAHGRVKAMYDTLRPRQKLKEAGPSTPVNVTGLDVAPQAGEKFYVLSDIVQARALADQRAANTRQVSLSGSTTKVSFEEFQRQMADGRLGQDEEVTILNLIIRADVRGSIEALLKELGKFDHPEVKIKVLQASVGGITVADVTLAHASGAVILGFNVIPDEEARSLADERGVEIRRYDIIYKVSDDIKAMLEGKLKPEERIIEMGDALVKQVFVISRVGAVAGCYVLRGSIERGCRIRVNREGRTIGDYAMESLKREKDDVKEVSRGMECGIKLANFNDIKQDDVLQAYKIQEFARTL